MDDLWEYARTVLGGMGEYENHIVFASTPITSGPNMPDIFIYNVNESTSAMATKQAAFMKSDAARMLGKHFRATLDCSNSLWIGQPVVTND